MSGWRSSSRVYRSPEREPTRPKIDSPRRHAEPSHQGPSPVDLLTVAVAEAVDAELWHRDRYFELIAEVTGQPVRRLGPEPRCRYSWSGAGRGCPGGG